MTATTDNVRRMVKFMLITISKGAAVTALRQRGLEPMQQIRNATQNKKTLQFGRLLICKSKMVRERL